MDSIDQLLSRYAANTTHNEHVCHTEPHSCFSGSKKESRVHKGLVRARRGRNL